MSLNQKLGKIATLFIYLNYKKLNTKNTLGAKNILQRLWLQIAPRRRLQILLILVLTIITSVTEIISLGAVAPFLIVLSSPGGLQSYPLIAETVIYLKLDDSNQVAIFFAILFAVAATIAGLMRLCLQWVVTKFCSSITCDFSIKIYEGGLYQPYLIHLSKHSSEIITGLTKINSLVAGVLQPMFSIVGAVPILLLILFALIYANALVAFSTIFFLGVVYGIITKLVYKRLAVYSAISSRDQVALLKSVQESLGGIRDVIIDGAQKVHLNRYTKVLLPYQSALASIFIACNIPRYAVEMFGMILIAFSVLVISLSDGDLKNAIPTLGFMALAAQRFLPLLQQTYSSVMTIRSSGDSVKDVLNLLEAADNYLPERKSKKMINFQQKILLKEISFSYPLKTKKIIDKLSLEIKKGEKIGIVGESGMGKSTLLDIIMGLITPNDGGIFVDGILVDDDTRQNWQKKIAHVPQDIFLLDGTVVENIAFGVANCDVDMDLVCKAASRAQISNIIENWPNSYHSIIGERGSKLSGGQRQRIGIARALYKGAEVIIFDEATSALDDRTEKDLMEGILSGLGLTLIIVAHRTSSLIGADKVFRLNNGKLSQVE